MDIIQLICAQRAFGHSLLKVDLAFTIFFQQIFKTAFRLPDKLGWADPFMRDHPPQQLAGNNCVGIAPVVRAMEVTPQSTTAVPLFSLAKSSSWKESSLKKEISTTFFPA
jgi:hypothetical protein